MNHDKQCHWQCEGPNFGRKSLQRRRPVRFSSFRDPSLHRLIISGGCERLLRDSKPRGRCGEDCATGGFCEADNLLEQSWHWRDHCQGWFHLLDHSLFFYIFSPVKVLFTFFTKLNSYLFPRLGAGRPQTDHSDHSQPVCLAGMKSSSLHSAFKKYISNSILEYHLKQIKKQIGPDVEL